LRSAGRLAHLALLMMSSLAVAGICPKVRRAQPVE
jgi:hypothetical protein